MSELESLVNAYLAVGLVGGCFAWITCHFTR